MRLEDFLKALPLTTAPLVPDLDRVLIYRQATDELEAVDIETVANNLVTNSTLAIFLAAFQELALKDSPNGYAGLNALSKIDPLFVPDMGGVPNFFGAGNEPIFISSNSLSAGFNDLYTVPAGKTLFLRSFHAWIGTATGSVTVYGAYKIGGNYYRGDVNRTVTATNGYGTSIGMVVNEGESLAINCASAGIRMRAVGVLVDKSVYNLSRKSVTLFNTTPQLMYQVPAGHRAHVLTGTLGQPYNPSSGGAVFHTNNTGLAVTHQTWFVPNGLAQDATNLVRTFSVPANSWLQADVFPHVMQAGDAIYGTSAASASDQLSAVVVVEFPV